MLLQIFSRYSWLAAIFFLFHQDVFFSCGILLCALVVWRFVKFSVLPRLYPDDPKELEYWIPREFSVWRAKIPGFTKCIHSAWLVQCAERRTRSPNLKKMLRSQHSLLQQLAQTVD